MTKFGELTFGEVLGNHCSLATTGWSFYCRNCVYNTFVNSNSKLPYFRPFYQVVYCIDQYSRVIIKFKWTIQLCIISKRTIIKVWFKSHQGRAMYSMVGRCDVVGSTLAFGSIGHGFESEHRFFRSWCFSLQLAEITAEVPTGQFSSTTAVFHSAS